MKLSDVGSEQALDSLNNEGQDSSTENAAEEHPVPSTDESQNDPVPQNETSEGAKQTTAQAQAIADLSKFSKVSLDGQEWTLDDLKKSIMRQNDYTRKMQDLAKERESQKFDLNLRHDLETIRQNPSALARFKQVYPKDYHRYADMISQGLTPSQAQAVQQQGQVALPPEIQERLDRYEERFRQLDERDHKTQQETLAKTLDNIEVSLLKKYPEADSMTALALADQARAKFEEENGRSMRPDEMNEKFLEPFYKRAHEYQLSRYEAYSKKQVTTARTTNERASDIGRGGGTPGAAPKKVKLGDVYDEIVREGI